MITKQQLADSFIHECDVCLHLATKLSDEGMRYQPSEQQRTSLDLLRYLSICAIAGMQCMAANDWTLFTGYQARVKDMTADQFPAAMQQQKAEIQQFFDNITEAELETRQSALPGVADHKIPLALALMNGPLKWLTAYKMQLFLYAKAASAPEIGTPNVWRGRDAVKQ